MTRKKNTELPVWLKATCCILPLLGLLTVCVGICFDANVHPAGLGGLTFLCWKVVGAALGSGGTAT